MDERKKLVIAGVAVGVALFTQELRLRKIQRRIDRRTEALEYIAYVCHEHQLKVEFAEIINRNFEE